jgi:FkbH-like protein
MSKPRSTPPEPGAGPGPDGQAPLPAQEELRALSREGRLAECFPHVRRLLAELPEEERTRAGRMLTKVDADDVLRHHPATRAVSVAVTGHGTLAELVPALAFEFARHGLVSRPYVADFGTYVYELSTADSGLYAARPDITLCVLDPDIVAGRLPVPWRPEDVEQAFEEKLRLLTSLAERHRTHAPGATLVLNTLPLPREMTAQLVDYRSRARLGALWREANARLLRMGEEQPGVVVLDLDPLLGEGIPRADARLSVYAKAHLSASLLEACARDIGHLARMLAGGGKKCLLVDLDETLWGGILGDDGEEGIEIGEGLRGEAFAGFQRTVKQLASQGLLLAAVSKNDLEPVRRVLRDHPGMVLREDDFVSVIANWRPKHENIRELAADLNLHTDSFVFADDSPYECGLVGRELPGVAVVRLDTEPALHAAKLLRDGWFDTRELTQEDRRRATLYREELDRKEFLSSFTSMDDYLRELGVTVRLAAATDREVPRISQITLRTNQFNLTTRRLQPADVQALIADPAAEVLGIHAGDRFGDNGLVGAVFLARHGDEVRIDNFLLSCRVFARGIEHACLSAVLSRARASGAASVTGTYQRTAKNGKVSGLYPLAGFQPAHGAHAAGGDTVEFRHDLTEIPEPPKHVRLTVSYGGSHG